VNPYYDDGQVQIWHGDCRNFLPSLAADVVVTDPPYGETSLQWDRWPDGWVSLVRPSSLWCCGSMRMFLDKRDEFAGWTMSQDVVWEKSNGSGFAADRFKRVHEHALHWYRGPWSAQRHEVPRVPRPHALDKSSRRNEAPGHTGTIGTGVDYVDDGTRLQRSVIAAQAPRAGRHPTEKPLTLLRPLITYSCPPGGVVLDPFAGSGTTLRAARDAGVRAIGIDSSERCCEMSAARVGSAEHSVRGPGSLFGEAS